MLVLTRKVFDEIMIGPDVVVQVLSIRRGKVSLGITAPIEVQVDRAEVRREIEEEAAEKH